MGRRGPKAHLGPSTPSLSDFREVTGLYFSPLCSGVGGWGGVGQWTDRPSGDLLSWSHSVPEWSSKQGCWTLSVPDTDEFMRLRVLSLRGVLPQTAAARTLWGQVCCLLRVITAASSVSGPALHPAL